VEARNAQRLDLEGVLARTRSSSHLPKEGPEGAALHDAVRALVERYAEDGLVTMAMRTVAIIGEVA
jgi:hypothetical protein